MSKHHKYNGLPKKTDEAKKSVSSDADARFAQFLAWATKYGAKQETDPNGIKRIVIQLNQHYAVSIIFPPTSFIVIAHVIRIDPTHLPLFMKQSIKEKLRFIGEIQKFALSHELSPIMNIPLDLDTTPGKPVKPVNAIFGVERKIWSETLTEEAFHGLVNKIGTAGAYLVQIFNETVVDPDGNILKKQMEDQKLKDKVADSFYS